MYILRLALQKMASRPGSTLFSVLLFAIGISIISLIMLADRNLNQSIERNFSSIDLVIGAKGSPSQLILSSVLHADYPTGNINLQQAENLARSPHVRNAIPLALGDSYRGFRIVGAPVEYPAIYNAQLAAGDWYHQVLEVTLGANVARLTGLKTGDQFYGVHGFHEAGHAHPEFLYTVKGILQPGAGVIDNLILTPVSSVWKVHHHDHDCEHDHHHAHDDLCSHDHDHAHVHDENCSHDHDHAHASCSHDHHADCDHDHHNCSHAAPEQDAIFHQTADQRDADEIKDPAIAAIREKLDNDEDISFEEMQLFQAYMQQRDAPAHADNREITAMLLQFRSPAGLIQLTRLINESTNLQAASPALEINRLMGLLSVGFDVFMTLAWIIIAISGINIFIHLWNTLRHGMQDIALMRVVGAGKMKVFLLLVFQGGLIAVAGWLAGIILSRIIWLFLPSMDFLTDSSLVAFSAGELTLLIYALITGVIASLIPAWTAYNTDVHFTLTRK
jgi:putative ABC transport system permease protein